MHLYQVKKNDAEQKFTHTLFSSSSGHGFLYRHINEFHDTKKKKHKSSRKPAVVPSAVEEIKQSTCGSITAS